jgi:hypothetical protein
MSMTKRLIESIELNSKKIKSENADLTWYQCLDLAILSVTNGSHHFCDLANEIQIVLLESPKDLEIAYNTLAKKLKKEKGISHMAARKLVSIEFGLGEDFHKKVKSHTTELGCLISARDEKLKKLSNRNWPGNLKEYLELPELSIDEENICLLDSTDLHQFDYIDVPEKVWQAHNFPPEFLIDGKGVYPFAVVKELGSLRNYRLPPSMAEFAFQVIQLEMMR